MEENIVIFTTDTCPKCEILKSKLKNKNIEYNEGDLKEIINAGFKSVPVLKINNEYLDFSNAIKYVNSYGKAGD